MNKYQLSSLRRERSREHRMLMWFAFYSLSGLFIVPLIITITAYIVLYADAIDSFCTKIGSEVVKFFVL